MILFTAIWLISAILFSFLVGIEKGKVTLFWVAIGLLLGPLGVIFQTICMCSDVVLWRRKK